MLDRITAQEIQYNLQILSETLASGKDVDLGFIPILLSDIRGLDGHAEDSARIDELTQMLHISSDRMLNRVESAKVFEDVHVPLIGDRIDFSDEAKKYDSCDVKSGYLALSQDYAMIPIRGDGHCLPRSIAAAHLRHLSTLSEDERAQHAINLSATVAELNDEQLSADMDRYSSIITEGLAHSDWYTLIRSPESSDFLVSFLRRLACAYNRQNHDEVFESVVEAYGYHSVDSYLSAMSDMDRPQPEMGGQPEIQALAKTLGVRIHTIDIKMAGQGQDMSKPHYYLGDDDAEDVYELLYVPGHYNLAVPKSMDDVD